MKSNVIAMMLLIMSFARSSASDESSRSNTPNLMQVYATIESLHEKANGNSMHFYAIAGMVSDNAEKAKEPQQQKCASHVLALVNEMCLTTSPKKRADRLQRFSNNFAECDKFVPGFVCNKR